MSSVNTHIQQPAKKFYVAAHVSLFCLFLRLERKTTLFWMICLSVSILSSAQAKAVFNPEALKQPRSAKNI